MPTKSGLRESLSVDKSSVVRDSRSSASEKVASSARACEPRANLVYGARQIPTAPKESESISMPDSYDALSKRELIGLLRLREHRFDEVDLATLRQHTLCELLKWQRRARQRVMVDEASEFARWVMNAGLCGLFERCGAGSIEKERQEVLWECAQAWKNQGAPWVGGSDIEALNGKVDRLTAIVASLVELNGGVVQPSLKLVEGGAAPARSAGAAP